MTVNDLIYNYTGLKYSKINLGLQFYSGEIYSLFSIFNVKMNRKFFKNFILLNWKIVKLPHSVEKVILDPGITLYSKVSKEIDIGNILILHRNSNKKYVSKIKLGKDNFTHDINILNNQTFAPFTLELCETSQDLKYFKTRYKPLKQAKLADKVNFYFQTVYPSLIQVYGLHQIRLKDFLKENKLLVNDLEHWYSNYGRKFANEFIDRTIPVSYVYGGPVFKDMYQTKDGEIILLDFERVMSAPAVHDNFRVPVMYIDQVKKNHIKFCVDGDLPLIDQFIICAFFINQFLYQPKWANEVKNVILPNFIDKLEND